MTPLRRPGLSGSGLWCADATPGFVARAARTGFDWLCLDLQHGSVTGDDLYRMISALGPDSPNVAVRVAGNDPALIGAALDAGADSVIVPSISSADEAARVVASSFYPPIGQRSWGQYAGLMGHAPRTTDELNALTTCAVMIETAGGMADLDAIAGVPGVGMLFIGPYDLALSLRTTVPDLLVDGEVIQTIVQAAHNAGISTGAFGGTPTNAARLRELGVDALAIAEEGALIARGAAAVLDEFAASSLG